MGDPAQDSDNQGPKCQFRRGERTGFFHAIKEIDDNLTVSFLLRDPGDLLPPFPEAVACFLQLSIQNSRRVTVPRPAIPSGCHNISETSSGDPVILKPEETGLGNDSGDVNPQRHMIRRSSSKRREYSARKHFIPGEIYKNSIKTLKSGARAFVGPSEAPISKGQLNEAHVIYTVIEGFCFSKSKVGIVLLMGESNHVEVPTNHPRCVMRRYNTFEFVQESVPDLRGGRSVHVSYVKRGTSECGGEMNREGIRGGGRTKTGKQGIRPSNEHASRRATGGREDE